MLPNDPLAALVAATMMMPDWRVDAVDAVLYSAHNGARMCGLNDPLPASLRPGDAVVEIRVSMRRRHGDGGVVVLSTARAPWDDAAEAAVRRLIVRAATPETPVALPLRLELAVGDYTVTEDAGGHLRALRHGAPWRDLCGDQLVGALAHHLFDAWDRLGVSGAEEALPDRALPPGADVAARFGPGVIVLRHPVMWRDAEVDRVKSQLQHAAPRSRVVAVPIPGDVVAVRARPSRDEVELALLRCDSGAAVGAMADAVMALLDRVAAEATS